MKKLIIILIMALSATTFAQTGIGTTTPNSSAQLDVSSTTKGFLLPRMTEAQRDAISSPATALIVWCSDCATISATIGEMQVFNGTRWTNIKGPTAPGAPTIGTATAGNTEVTVAFTAPANDGGSTITSYTATSNPGNFTGTVTQAGSGTITVTGLTNGTAYTFTVTATNAVGISIVSAASNSVTPIAPIAGTNSYPVTNPATSRIWMDRNLGATQVATASDDYLAYGSLYQWGRLSDGHQLINWTSSTGSDGVEQTNETTALSAIDVPGHGNFITGNDWRNPANNALWQGISGTNNPCPSGYRLPTDVELDAERLSWSSNNAAGAFGSPLKLPAAGYRFRTGSLNTTAGTSGAYWSSTVSAPHSHGLSFGSSTSLMGLRYRGDGVSVRCIKD